MHNARASIDDDYDDDAYTDTKALLMMLTAIMIVGMRDGVNIVKDDDDSDDRLLSFSTIHAIASSPKF